MIIVMRGGIWLSLPLLFSKVQKKPRRAKLIRTYLAVQGRFWPIAGHYRLSRRFMGASSIEI
jgi:hypothetical protein